MPKNFDIIIVGSGPGGEVGAIRAAQLGAKVAIIEKRAHLGGTCLNVGCIPTKALLASAKYWDKLKKAEEFGFSLGTPSFNWAKILARKDQIVDQQRKGLSFLMKKNNIEVFQGHGSLAGPKKIKVKKADGTVEELGAEHIILATGSKVRELPFAPSTGKDILNSDHILSIDHIPASLVIIGGGVVGVEFASLFGRMGSQVTIVELSSQLLPTEDEETVQEFTRHLKKQNVTILTKSKLSKLVEDPKGGVLVELEGQKPLHFAKALVCIGRAPVSEDLGLESVGLKPLPSGHLSVNAHCQTEAKGIYAIGDLIPTPALAHTASAEAIYVTEFIRGHKPHPIAYASNPSAIYSYPEVASVGLTEAQLKKAAKEYKVAKFPFAPLAKAKIEDMTQGFVKILFGPKHREILGVHIVGAMATEMIAEFGLGQVLESTLDEIGQTIHPHPTLSETIMEAAHMGLGGAIHF